MLFRSLNRVRRLKGQLEALERALDEETGKPARFAYPPNLIVVDGGLPQVNAAQAVLDEKGVVDVTVVGLAKRLEEVWVPGEDHPLVLPRNSEGLYLLQRVRDEAHRFAIEYHRSLRGKEQVRSVLDDIKGIGPARRKSLMRTFKTIEAAPPSFNAS